MPGCFFARDQHACNDRVQHACTSTEYLKETRTIFARTILYLNYIAQLTEYLEKLHTLQMQTTVMGEN